MFKKIALITLLTIAVLFAVMMTGCGKKATTTDNPVDTTMTAPAPADTAMAPAPAPEAPAPAPEKK